MSAPELSANQQYRKKKPLRAMTSWMKNQIENLFSAVSATMRATFAKDALQSTRQESSLLCNRMIGNTEYGPERLKVIEKKETRQNEKQSKDKKRTTGGRKH